MLRAFLSLAGFLATLASVSAVSILSPGDPIVGGVVSGGQFIVGVDGTLPGVNNWPPGEPPSDILNGLIGGPNEKYLNFAELNTGIVVTPLAGASTVTSITFFVANDAVERDPTSYELWGTNVTILGTGPFDQSDFNLISSGALTLPPTRDTITDLSGFSQTVNFLNSDDYTSYMLVFPTVFNEAIANSMQISEVVFEGTLIPEPLTPTFLGVGLALAALRRRRK